MLHERDAKPADGDAQRHSSPARHPAVVPWDATDASTCSPQQKRRQDEPPSRGDASSAAEVNLKTSMLSCSILINCETSWCDSATTQGAKMQPAESAISPALHVYSTLCEWRISLQTRPSLLVYSAFFSAAVCQHFMTVVWAHIYTERHCEAGKKTLFFTAADVKLAATRRKGRSKGLMSLHKGLSCL